MANNLTVRKQLEAFKLFHQCHSIREVMDRLGIARETATRLSGCFHAAMIDSTGSTIVPSGCNAVRKKVGYQTKEMRPQWAREYSRSADRKAIAVLALLIEDGVVTETPGSIGSDDPFFTCTGKEYIPHPRCDVLAGGGE